MRSILLIAWLFIGLGFVIFHYGPGVRYAALDDASHHARDAHRAAEQEDWAEAVELYDQATGALPDDCDAEAMRLRLERSKAQMMAAELPEAREALAGLLAEAAAHCADDQQFINDTRAALANSQYYTTWLMRLEGAPKSEWEPEIEAARQHFKVLAEDSQHLDDAQETQRHLKDLEATIRLARLDLKDLQALPLPNQ